MNYKSLIDSAYISENSLFLGVDEDLAGIRVHHEFIKKLRLAIKPSGVERFLLMIPEQKFHKQR
jgi:hypothetical protein